MPFVVPNVTPSSLPTVIVEVVFEPVDDTVNVCVAPKATFVVLVAVLKPALVANVIDELLNVKLPKVKVEPAATDKEPVTAKFAPVVKVLAEPFNAILPPTVVITQPVVVAVPDIVKFPLTVVTEVIVFAPDPDNVKFL